MSFWPHAPIHRLDQTGAYIVTAATYQKVHYFRSVALVDFLQENLVTLAKQYDWQLQAWAIFSNHYHFVALSPLNPSSLRGMISHLHSISAQEANQQDNAAGRKVWFQYWDTHLTYERSYYARLNYVHQNPVRHGLVPAASAYPWCSAAWFERTSNTAFFKTITSFKTDKLKIQDNFEVMPIA